jgi:alpha-ketoglutarate-dependent taurine dioxygenase
MHLSEVQRTDADAPAPAVRPCEELVTTGSLPACGALPLVIRPAAEGLSPTRWAEANRDFLDAQLLRHGGILFRDFEVTTPAEFEQFIRAAAGELLEYRERSSPRTQVGGNVYTSTDYPAGKSIHLHNENSYQDTWPAKIFFYCAVAARQGGETPIADCRKVLARLSPGTRERFARKKWMYVRNYGDGFGLSWQSVFQTDDPAQVERHCREHDIEVEWKEGGRLRTRAVRPAISRHPRTGELTWFNHAAFFHVTSLDEGMRRALLEVFAEDDLPSNTFYGDGSAIEAEVLEEVRAAYRDETVAFPWREGDVLMLDNMLVAHARRPFVGPRKVLVGMAQPVSRRDV